jgi:hypothetical protein
MKRGGTLKRTPLQRKTPLRRVSQLSYKKRANTIVARLATHSKDAVPQTKLRIQALLRSIVIKRDGGCILRGSPEAGACGGYGSKSGKLILQAEHLNSRSNSISFGDLRNIVCICQRHHLYFKPQHSRLYWELIESLIGPERWEWVKRVEKDKNPYRFTHYDWLKVEMGLAAHWETIRGVDTKEVMGNK